MSSILILQLNTNWIRSILDNINVIKIINMYEAIQHYQVYKQRQEKLKQAKQEMDKFITKLITKNGVTKY